MKHVYSSYRPATALMLVAILPVSLLGLSLLLWRDEAGRVPFSKVLVNNGAGLYVLGVIPAWALSALHTRIMTRRAHPSVVYSTMVGAAMGLSTSMIILLVMFQGLVAATGTILAWAAATGGLYGMVAGILSSRMRVVANRRSRTKISITGAFPSSRR